MPRTPRITRRVDAIRKLYGCGSVSTSVMLTLACGHVVYREKARAKVGMLVRCLECERREP